MEEDHKDKWVEITEEVLGYASLTILGLLGIEILLVFVAFGLKFFKVLLLLYQSFQSNFILQHPFYVLDMVVIGLSIVFEVVFKEAVGTLLIIFRLWVNILFHLSLFFSSLSPFSSFFLFFFICFTDLNHRGL